MRRIGAVIVLILFALLSACVSSENKSQAISQYKLGQSELQSGNIQQAYVRFHESLIKDPGNYEVHHALGYVNIVLGDYGKAENNLLQAVKIKEDYSEAWNTLCSLYHIYLGRYEAAINACEKALENNLYTTPEKSLYNLGRIYYKTGNNRRSLKYIDKATRRLPSWFPPYYSKALAYNALGQYNNASEALDTAIGLDPRFQGDKKKAEKHFRNNRTKRKFFESPAEADQLIDILHY